MIISEYPALNSIGLQVYTVAVSFRPLSVVLLSSGLAIGGLTDESDMATTNRLLRVLEEGADADPQWLFLGAYNDSGTARYVFDCGLEVGP